MTRTNFSRTFWISLSTILFVPALAFAQQSPCAGLPTNAELRAALVRGTQDDGGAGGLNLNMWATVVNRDGIVCAVAFTGTDRGSQWPGSRVISAQKANTSNAFSLAALALSTANLFSAVQPGGSLFGLQESNPVNTAVAYGGDAANFGTANDPMVGGRIGGVNVFGGGLALYNSSGTLVGGIGVSGDTSCADHIIAWKTRWVLNLDAVPAGVSDGTDNMIHDISTDSTGHQTSRSGFGHPTCTTNSAAAVPFLTRAFPVGRNP